jgi:hypothetical protein
VFDLLLQAVAPQAQRGSGKSGLPAGSILDITVLWPA